MARTQGRRPAPHPTPLRRTLRDVALELEQTREACVVQMVDQVAMAGTITEVGIDFVQIDTPAEGGAVMETHVALFYVVAITPMGTQMPVPAVTKSGLHVPTSPIVAT